jgi:hypothetical protein
MKTIYLVPYWVPFPSSEYGGVQVVIADGKHEARQLLIDAVEDYEKLSYPDYERRISKCLDEALKYPVQVEDSGIVYDFLT